MSSVFGNMFALHVLFLLHTEPCEEMAVLQENVSLHRAGKWFCTGSIFNHAQKLYIILYIYQLINLKDAGGLR